MVLIIKIEISSLVETDFAFSFNWWCNSNGPTKSWVISRHFKLEEQSLRQILFTKPGKLYASIPSGSAFPLVTVKSSVYFHIKYLPQAWFCSGEACGIMEIKTKICFTWWFYLVKCTISQITPRIETFSLGGYDTSHNTETHKFIFNRACHPGGHNCLYYPGNPRSSGQVPPTHLKMKSSSESQLDIALCEDSSLVVTEMAVGRLAILYDKNTTQLYINTHSKNEQVFHIL